MAGHAEYRGWCPFCVTGRGKVEAHRSKAERDHQLPTLSIDYSFLGKKHEKASPVLLGRFHKDRWLLTNPVPVKGASHKWIIQKLTDDIE